MSNTILKLDEDKKKAETIEIKIPGYFLFFTKGKKKTVVCKHWLNGTCKMGDECTFLHEYDMERMPDLSKKRKDSLHGE